MINNFLYNSFLEILIFFIIVVWFIGACTIIIPFVCMIMGDDYFYLKPTIDNIRDNKI